MTFVDSHEVVYSLLERLRKKSSVVNPKHHCCGLAGTDNNKKPCRSPKKLNDIVENAARLLDLLELAGDEGTDEFPPEIEDLVFKTHCSDSHSGYTRKHIDAWWESGKRRDNGQARDKVTDAAKEKRGRPGPPPREAAPVTPLKKQSRRVSFQVTPDFSLDSAATPYFDDGASDVENSDAESYREPIFDSEVNSPETPDTILSLEGRKTGSIVSEDEPSPTRHKSKGANKTWLDHSEIPKLDYNKPTFREEEGFNDERETEIKPPRLTLESVAKGEASQAAQPSLTKTDELDVKLKPMVENRSFLVTKITILSEIVKDMSLREREKGIVYVLYSEELDCFKVGYSNCSSLKFTRYANKDCSLKLQLVARSTGLFPGAKRVEKLVHTDLYRQRQHLVNKCPSCDKGHREWFKADDEKEILDCVRRWTRFVLQPAYDEKTGKLVDEMRMHLESLWTSDGIASALGDAPHLPENDNLTPYDKGEWIPRNLFTKIKIDPTVALVEPRPGISNPADSASSITALDDSKAKIAGSLQSLKLEPNETTYPLRPLLKGSQLADEQVSDEREQDERLEVRTQEKAKQKTKKSKKGKIMQSALSVADSGTRRLDKLIRSTVLSFKTEQVEVVPERQSGPTRGLRRRLTGGFAKPKRTVTA